MPYGGHPYGGVGYAGANPGAIPDDDTAPHLHVQVAFSTDALATPVWEDITADVRSWSTTRGRTRELERYQPGRATVILGNRDRQYDSVYDAGPHFGELRPMRRFRIRETFNGTTFPVFDGFVDSWRLDYPGMGKDAVCVLTATEGPKILARTALPPSVYASELLDAAPTVWWRCDEDIARLQDGEALNSGAGGSTYDAAYVNAPFVGDQTVVVNDPGAGMRTQSSEASNGTPLMGFTVPNATLDLLAQTTFAIEAWVRLDAGGFSVATLLEVASAAGANRHAVVGYVSAGGTGTDGQMAFIVNNSAFTLAYGVQTPAGSVLPGGVYHVVAVVESGGQMALWLNGTRYTTLVTGGTATSLSGITRPSGGRITVAHQGDSTPNPINNWHGTIDELAIYFPTPPTDAVIDSHYDAGSHPWQGDLPGERAERILDLAEWPAALRELDDGEETLQSADIAGQTALEHLQKLGETEAGAFFFTREGKARLIARAALFARSPGPHIFGDDSGELGYRAISVTDGDEVIRNTAVISRLNGVAKRASDSGSVSEFGPFTYTLEGLLHDSDAHSQEYADFIVAEYAEPRRRVTSLTLGPAVVGEEAALYPAMLGLELAEAITVRSRPLGGGDPFEQVCVVEGIDDAGAPGGIRTRTLRLSPEFSGDF